MSCYLVAPYRHTFVLSKVDKQQIWQTVEKLLADNQVEVSSHKC